MQNESDMTVQPLVSVLMPSFNAESFIEAAIQSVIGQTVSDWEMIIIDDGSRDSTCEIIESLCRKDSRIHLYKNERNMGAANSRNRGLDMCRGEYVALLDSDDLWYPEKLEKQIALAKAKKADIVYCSYAIIDEEGRKKCPDFIVPEYTSAKATLSKSVISCSTALLSKRVVSKYRFPTGFYHEDLAFWLQMLSDGVIAVGAADVLAEYRVRSNSRASNKITVARGRWQIYRKMMGMSFGESIYHFIQYAFIGFRKYRRG